MYLADTLSRAYLPEAHVCVLAQERADVDHALSLALPPDRAQQLQHASAMTRLCRNSKRSFSRGGLKGSLRYPKSSMPTSIFRMS